MSRFLVLCLVALIMAGCATRGTVESRKKQKATAYAALATEERALVDTGQIKAGMPMDAVYIAWGKPSQIVQNENPNGLATIWLYEGYNYSIAYIQAEVVFIGGVVKQWRTFPRPPFY